MKTLLSSISSFLLFISFYTYSVDGNYLDLLLEGNFKQGGLLFGKVHPDSSVKYNGRDLFIDNKGRFVLGFGRDEKKNITLTVSKGNNNKVYSYSVQKRNYKVQSINGVENRFVYPSQKDIARSKLEAKAVKIARNIFSEQSDFFSGFIWPAIGPVTGVYGSQRVFNGEARRPHYGVDIAAPIGSPVKAPASGIVTFAESDLFFSGGTMIIDHGHGLSSTFLHLEELVAEVGQKISQGELVATVGNTGRVTGPHLDWRMNWSSKGISVRIDPQLLVSSHKEKNFGN